MDSSNPPVLKQRPFPWLIVTLLFVTALGAAVLWRNKHSPSDDKLHGDSEGASLALGEALDKMPKADRLSFLLKDANDASPGLRYAAIDALGNQRNPQAVAAIESAFTDSSSVVRQRALEVLPPLDHDRGLRLLLSGLRDEDRWIREAAILQMKIFLGRKPEIVDRRAVPILIKTLDDDSPAVAGTATSLLSKLTGNPWTVRFKDPTGEKLEILERWRQWWKTEHNKWPAAGEYSAAALIMPARTDPAPDIQLTDIERQAIPMPGQSGHIMLLNFWGSWCAHCQLEMQGLKRLHDTYGKAGVDIIGIAVAETHGEKGVREFCKTQGIPYRQVMGTKSIQRAFGDIEEVPVSILIDRKGKVRYRWDGGRDYGTFRAAIERLLHEQ
jgi:peroxiredoxin